MEELASRDSGRLIVAEVSGTISYVDAKKITVKDDKGKDHTYPLISFSRTNNFSVFHQRPSVSMGDHVKKGQVIADTSTTDHGQIALGQNALVAFMSWGGANYEDAIILSERLVKQIGRAHV